MMASTLVKLGNGNEGTRYYCVAVDTTWSIIDTALLHGENSDTIVDCENLVASYDMASDYHKKNQDFKELAEMCRQALAQDIPVLLLYS